jgi:hypothetical protein
LILSMAGSDRQQRSPDSFFGGCPEHQPFSAFPCR